MMAEPKFEHQEKLSKYRLIALTIFSGYSSCAYGILISLQPPFYPEEAEKKGATPSQYGFVFGILHVFGGIFSLIFGRYGAIIGPKRLCITGAYFQGFVALLFGLLTYIDELLTFLGVSYILRIMGGISEAAASQTLVSIMSNIFSSHVPKVVAYLEMTYGLGYAMGPVVGSTLYTIGGFKLPFILAGFLEILLATILLFLIPCDCDAQNGEHIAQESLNQEKKVSTFKSMLVNPTILIPFVDLFVTTAGQGIFLAMMAPHLVNVIGADHKQTAMVFGSWGFTYVFGALIAGFVGSFVKYPVLLSLLGDFCFLISLSLAGPLPFLPIEPSGVLYFMVVLGLAALGTNCEMNSVFTRAKRAAEKKGFPADIGTLLIISGMWNCTYFFGAFVGATGAGFLVEHFNFEVASAYFWVAILFTIALDVCELVREFDTKSKDRQHQATNCKTQMFNNLKQTNDILDKYGSIH